MSISFRTNLKYKIACANTWQNSNSNSTLEKTESSLMERVRTAEIFSQYWKVWKVCRLTMHLIMLLKVTGVVERFNQELYLRKRVLLVDTGFADALWAEAMHHGNWLRNRPPSRRLNGQLSKLIWKPHTVIPFQNLPIFGEYGFAFNYKSKTSANRKLTARS